MLQKLFQRLWTSPAGRSGAGRRPRCRPAPEVLEGRLAPAVLTVNTLADETTADTVLSLREAIGVLDAGSTAGLSGAELGRISGPLGTNDTIQFDPSLAGGTITLTGGALAITSPVTIAGPSAASLTIDGGGSDRVFVVGRIFTQSLGLGVAISRLTVTGGSAAYGGGLLNFGTLALSNDVISGNTATADGGGGVYNDGALTLTGCTFSNNTTQGTSSTAGGGLDSIGAGTVTAVNCTFANNSAGGSGAAASSGGGAANSGTMTLTGCTFSNNSAASNGGGLYSDGALTIGTTTFSNDNAGSDGGAVRSGGSSLAVTASTFTGNTAASAGGALDTSDATAALINCTLAGNTAGSLGGAVQADTTGGAVTLTNVTITANRVTTGSGGRFGGGVSAERPVSLDNTLVAGNFQGATGITANDVTGNLASASSYNLIGAGGSGGLSNGVNGNQVGVSNPRLGSLADNGGPTPTVLPQPGSPALAAGSTAYITAGETDQRGLPRVFNGAVDVGAVETQVIVVTTPAVLTVNSPADTAAPGSALTLREAVALVDGTLGRPLTAGEQAQVSGTLGFDDTIQFSLPAGPQTITLAQGALDITNDVTIAGPGAGSLTVNGGGSDRVFVVGQSSTQGPGPHVALSGLTISGGNAAYGAGLLTFGTLALSNDVISNNAATGGSGGGIYNGGALTLTGCTLSGNSTQGSYSTAGGGLDNVTGGTVTATGCTFSGNIAGGSGTAASDGGAVANSGPLTLTGCTFSNNQAASDGGALYSYGTLTITTTTFSNNIADSDGGAIRSGDSSLTITASTFSGNTAASLGGALTLTSDAAVLTNCTLYGNTAGSQGGAVWAEVKGSPATLTNVTVTANRATFGLGGFFGGGVWANLPLTLDNTLVAGNFRGPTGTTPDDVTGALDPASAYNLIGTGGSGGLSDGVNGNLVGVSDLRLGPLADNGGPTQTVLPLRGSPALGAGSTAFVSPGETDQRGLPRVFAGAVDVGAVEVQAKEPVTVRRTKPSPHASRGIFARLVTGKVRKKTRLIVEVFSADTGALKKKFVSPFQGPAYKDIRVSVRGGNGGGPDEVVVIARKGKRSVSDVFPV